MEPWVTNRYYARIYSCQQGFTYRELALDSSKSGHVIGLIEIGLVI